MKKRWIILGLIATAFAYYQIQGNRNLAKFESRPKYDGTFVLREGEGQWPEVRFYKYGARLAKCIGDYCMVSRTRKDSEALLEKKSDTQGYYCYEVDKPIFVDPMSPKMNKYFED
jgi:hypothetical protein